MEIATYNEFPLNGSFFEGQRLWNVIYAIEKCLECIFEIKLQPLWSHQKSTNQYDGSTEDQHIVQNISQIS